MSKSVLTSVRDKGGHLAKKAVHLLVHTTKIKVSCVSRLLELFRHVSDFWNVFAPSFRVHQLSTKADKRQRTGQLSSSEVMTILIAFHQSP